MKAEVTLRAIEPEDLDLLYRIENDMSLWGIGTTNIPYSRYQLHDYVSNASGDIYADKQARLVVENQSGETVGLVDLISFDPRNLRAEVGIVIEAPHRRKGYAQAALTRLHDYAKSVLHIHQLYAYVDASNEPSMALFKQLGYHAGEPLTDWLFDGNRYAPALLFRKFL